MQRSEAEKQQPHCWMFSGKLVCPSWCIDLHWAYFLLIDLHALQCLTTARLPRQMAFCFLAASRDPFYIQLKDQWCSSRHIQPHTHVLLYVHDLQSKRPKRNTFASMLKVCFHDEVEHQTCQWHATRDRGELYPCRMNTVEGDQSSIYAETSRICLGIYCSSKVIKHGCWSPHWFPGVRFCFANVAVIHPRLDFNRGGCPPSKNLLESPARSPSQTTKELSARNRSIRWFR